MKTSGMRLNLGCHSEEDCGLLGLYNSLINWRGALKIELSMGHQSLGKFFSPFPLAIGLLLAQMNSLVTGNLPS